MKTTNTVQSTASLLSLLWIVTFPLFFIFRGIDLTDTGFVLTNQHLFFSHPEHVSYWFHLYLTNLTGAIVDALFGGYGLIAMKIASAIIFWIVAFLVYRISSRFLHGWIVLLSLAVTAFFWFAGKINIVHYNNLSALFYLLICYFLLKGYETKRLVQYLFAGIFAVAAFFTRIPNALAIFIIVAIPIWTMTFGKKDKAPSVACIIAYIAGVALAFLLMILVMVKLGHLTIYIDSIQSLFGTSTTDSKYGLFRIFKRTVRHTLRAGYNGLFFILLASLPAIPLLIAKHFKIRAISTALVAILATSVLCYLAFPISAIAGIAYITTVVALFLPSTEKNERLTIASILCAASIACLCVGSDTGLDVSTYLYPLAIPLAIAILRALSDTDLFGKSGIAKQIAKILPVSLILYLAATSALSINNVYRDTEKLDTKPSAQRLQGVLTSRTRAMALDTVTTEIRARYAPGTELFVWDSAPLIHYATDTLPWLYNPWPVLYASDTGNEGLLNTMLEQRALSNNFAPILIARVNPRGGSWPVGGKNEKYLDTIVNLMEKYAYSLVWENSDFSLYEKK